MTDNQFREMMDKVTKCVNGIQVLRTDVTELKTDVAILKAGQSRLEKGMETTNRALDTLAGESIRVKSRVEILEERIN